MPLLTFSTQLESKKELAEKFNVLEVKLVSIVDPTERANVQTEMDELRRLYNLYGGSAARAADTHSIRHAAEVEAAIAAKPALVESVERSIEPEV